MDELHQILNIEEENRNKILEAEKEAKKAFESKREDLEMRLQKDSIVTSDEEKELAGDRDKRMESIKKDFDNKLSSEIKKMSEKKTKNMAKAVSYIINSLKNNA